MTKSEHERAVNAIYTANVRAELARRKMTHTQLAERSGVPIESLRRRMRSGKWAASWTVSELERVARALGVPMETLTQGAERAES